MDHCFLNLHLAAENSSDAKIKSWHYILYVSANQIHEVCMFHTYHINISTTRFTLVRWLLSKRPLLETTYICTYYIYTYIYVLQQRINYFGQTQTQTWPELNKLLASCFLLSPQAQDNQRLPTLCTINPLGHLLKVSFLALSASLPSALLGVLERIRAVRYIFLVFVFCFFLLPQSVLLMRHTYDSIHCVCIDILS